MLIVNRNAVVSVERQDIWGDDVPETGLATPSPFLGCGGCCRRPFDSSMSAPGYRLAVDRETTDVDRFEAGPRRGSTARTRRRRPPSPSAR
jgi:DNA-binding SARP family transcriptional activator